MNESDTRLHKIDPKLKAAGWGTVEGSRITTEYTFTKGKISQTMKGKPKRADYLLIYKGVKLAVVEAKSDELSYSEGVGQAKEYADMLGIRYTYATNGNDIYEDTERTVPFVLLLCSGGCRTSSRRAKTYTGYGRILRRVRHYSTRWRMLAMEKISCEIFAGLLTQSRATCLTCWSTSHTPRHR